MLLSMIINLLNILYKPSIILLQVNTDLKSSPACLNILFGAFIDSNLHLLYQLYPDWVIEKCYTCQFQDKVDKVNVDWNQTIPDLMNAPNKIFKQAGDDFKSVFT